MHDGPTQTKEATETTLATRGDFTLSVPLGTATGKAIAAGAVSGAAGYGVKKGLDATTRKKRVGKRARASQRVLANMRRRWHRVAKATS